MQPLDIYPIDKKIIKKALVVDSEPKIRELIAFAIQGPELQVVEAGNFDAFWKLIIDYKPDLVVIDPSQKRDRYDFNLLKHLMGRTETKFLLLGPPECKREYEKIKNEGLASYCLKPFSPRELSFETHKLMNECGA